MSDDWWSDFPTPEEVVVIVAQPGNAVENYFDWQRKVDELKEGLDDHDDQA